jgi:hypothetical protein
MGEIKYTHHAGNHTQAKNHQYHDGCPTENTKKYLERAFHASGMSSLIVFLKRMGIT